MRICASHGIGRISILFKYVPVSTRQCWVRVNDCSCDLFVTCHYFWCVLYVQSEALDRKFDINLHDIGELGYEVISNAEYSVNNKIAFMFSVNVG